MSSAVVQPRKSSRAAAALLVAAMLVARPAEAEPTPAERIVARDRFQQGLELERKDDCDAALVHYRAVARVVSTPNVHFHLGLCLEQTGHFVQALDELERALALARGAPDPDPGLLASAREHAASLRKRTPTISLRLPRLVDGSETSVTVDESRVAASLLDRPLPVDPGTHTIAVSAPGHAPFRTRVHALESAAPIVVDVSLVPLADTRPAPSQSVAGPSDEDGTRSSPARPIAYALGITGLASGCASVVLYLLRSSAISDLDAVCGAGRSACPPSSRDLADRGETYTTLANVTAGVSAVALASAVVLLLLAPSRPSTARGR